MKRHTFGLAGAARRAGGSRVFSSAFIERAIPARQKMRGERGDTGRCITPAAKVRRGLGADLDAAARILRRERFAGDGDRHDFIFRNNGKNHAFGRKAGRKVKGGQIFILAVTADPLAKCVVTGRLALRQKIVSDDRRMPICRIAERRTKRRTAVRKEGQRGIAVKIVHKARGVGLAERQNRRIRKNFRISSEGLDMHRHGDVKMRLANEFFAVSVRDDLHHSSPFSAACSSSATVSNTRRPVASSRARL